MLPVRAVAFDLGGVMVRIHHNWNDALRAAGHDASKDFGPLGGFPEFDLYQSGDVSDQEFLRALSDFLETTEEAAHRVHLAVLREQYEGVDLLAQELVDRGILCGCLSNTNSLHWEALFGGRYTFSPFLKVRIGSHIVGSNKPDAVIFEAFEQACACELSQIAYFDDGPANVEAATKRGWKAWLIDPAADTANQMRGHLGI